MKVNLDAWESLTAKEREIQANDAVLSVLFPENKEKEKEKVRDKEKAHLLKNFENKRNGFKIGNI